MTHVCRPNHVMIYGKKVLRFTFYVLRDSLSTANEQTPFDTLRYSECLFIRTVPQALSALCLNDHSLSVGQLPKILI